MREGCTSKGKEGDAMATNRRGVSSSVKYLESLAPKGGGGGGGGLHRGGRERGRGDSGSVFVTTANVGGVKDVAELGRIEDWIPAGFDIYWWVQKRSSSLTPPSYPPPPATPTITISIITVIVHVAPLYLIFATVLAYKSA